MDIEARLLAIQEIQSQILALLTDGSASAPRTMNLKEAAKYTGYSTDHFRRLAVEQRIIPYIRPSGQQKGKLLFRREDLDNFLESSRKEGKEILPPGRRRKSKDIRIW